MIANKKTFNWGIVGTGYIVEKFLNDILFLDSHKVVGISSRNEKYSKKIAEQYNIPNYFNNHLDILNLKNIDAVYIATDTSLHKSLSIEFLQNKVPVLCEKPFATSLSDAIEIINLAKQNSVLFMEAMWMLYLPSIKEIINDIQSNKIGQIISFDASYGKYFVKNESFRLFNKKIGGGCLYDFGIYPIALLSNLTNNILDIKSFGKINEFGVDDYFSSLISFEGGQATISCSIVNLLSNTATISGTLGKIVIDSPMFNPPGYIIYNNKEEIIGGKNIKYKGFGLREQAEYFKQIYYNNNIESQIYGFDKMIQTMDIMQKISNQIGLSYV